MTRLRRGRCLRRRLGICDPPGRDIACGLSMSRTFSLVAVIVGLTVVVPISSAIAETWCDGIYDAESNDIGQAVSRSSEGPVQASPIPSPAPILIVVSIVPAPDEGPPPPAVRTVSDTRGPPRP